MATSLKPSKPSPGGARKRKNGDIVLTPVHPNAGIEAEYARKLTALVEEMNRSILYWVRAAYRANEPEVSELASDESPAAAMRRAIRKLRARWLKRFDEGAKDLADYFAQSVSERSDGALKAILKKAGFTVEFRLTAAQNDILQATIGEQVNLIKSIPRQYLQNVEGLVMRSVQTGRDLGQLTKDLQEQHGVTKRRAAFIAQSQNNMATASLTRARQVELGITECQWLHSGGGKHPRPSHLKAGRDQVRYDPAKGWFDPDANKFIWPGELPNCRCVSKAVIKGFS